MIKRGLYLGRLFRASGILAALAVMLSAAPNGLTAQAGCSGCAWDPEYPGDQVCGDPGGTMRCEGASGGVCTQCSNQQYASVPSDLALDGSAVVLPSPLVLLLEATGDSDPSGVSVQESVCGNVVSRRQYSAETAEGMRTKTALLVFK